MTTHISFDMDGTLISDAFDKLIWHEEIPKMYSEKHGVGLGESKTKVFAEYYRVLYLEESKRWTDVSFWFRRFGLDNWEKLFEDSKAQIEVYPEVIKTLETLSKKYKLIVVSSADRKFLDLKLDVADLKKYFTHTFSAPSDFQQAQKNKHAFEKILEQLNLTPNQLVHIGDDHYLDYIVPQSLGMKAFHVVRAKKMNEEHVVHSLSELLQKF